MDASHAFSATEDCGVQFHDTAQPAGNDHAGTDRLLYKEDVSISIHTKIDTTDAVATALPGITQALSAGLGNITAFDLDVEWRTAMEGFDAVRQALSLKGMSDELIDSLVSAETVVGEKILTLPVRSIVDATTKLRTALTLYSTGHDEELQAILSDMEGLCDHAVQTQPRQGAELEALAGQLAGAMLAYDAIPGDGGPLEDNLHAAIDALDAYEPRTPEEFVRLFAVRYPNGLQPTDDDFEALVEIAARLSAPTAEDPAIVEAFGQYRSAAAELSATPCNLSDAAIERQFYSRMDPADVRLQKFDERDCQNAIRLAAQESGS